jgi:uracil-DNA glycosylase
MPVTGTFHRDVELASLASRISACRICVEAPDKAPLPHQPHPVAQLSATARICIAGQAPGTRVHASGRPFTDPSGDRLRNWLGMTEYDFYDSRILAIVPMGFCFPGLDARGSDLPPRRECVRQWHDPLFQAMPQLDMIIAIGAYAQRYHLGARVKGSLTETVAAWREITVEPGVHGVPVWPLPHPSWRNSAWLKRNPWFEDETLPAMRAAMRTRMRSDIRTGISSMRSPEP